MHVFYSEMYITFFLFISHASDDQDDQKLLKYEIVLESSYNFLHDVNYYAKFIKQKKEKKAFNSPYRTTTVKQFLATLKK